MLIPQVRGTLRDGDGETDMRSEVVVDGRSVKFSTSGEVGTETRGGVLDVAGAGSGLEDGGDVGDEQVRRDSGVDRGRRGAESSVGGSVGVWDLDVEAGGGVDEGGRGGLRKVDCFKGEVGGTGRVGEGEVRGRSWRI